MKEISFEEAWGKLGRGEELWYTWGERDAWLGIRLTPLGTLQLESQLGPEPVWFCVNPFILDDNPAFSVKEEPLEFASVTRGPYCCEATNKWEWNEEGGRAPYDILVKAHKDTPIGTVIKWRQVVD